MTLLCWQYFIVFYGLYNALALLKFSFQICEKEFQSWAIFAIRSFRSNPYRRDEQTLMNIYMNTNIMEMLIFHKRMSS